MICNDLQKNLFSQWKCASYKFLLLPPFVSSSLSVICFTKKAQKTVQFKGDGKGGFRWYFSWRNGDIFIRLSLDRRMVFEISLEPLNDFSLTMTYENSSHACNKLFCVGHKVKTLVTIQTFNSLWPCDAIWRQRSVSTLAQVMACCLTAPSHYLNQCWLVISEVQWYSYSGNFTKDASTINY